jgi:hypothetical protein
MEKLSQIAQEYLQNYEVLRIARNSFDRELTEWWRTLVKDTLSPALSGNPNVKELFDNNARPGCFEIHSHSGKLSVRVWDPHHNGTRDYQVVISGKQKWLKKLRNNPPLIEEFQTRGDLGHDQLFPTNYTLMVVPVPIQGDKPDATFEEVKSKMLQLLKVAEEIEARL